MQNLLVCFDMDSTLLNCETLPEIAKELGLSEEISKITQRGMDGELDFKESLRMRLELLKGTNVEVIKKINQNMPLMPGALELCKKLKRNGAKIAILTGGFQCGAKILAKKIGADYFVANKFETHEGKLTGGFVLNTYKSKHLLLQMLKNTSQAKYSVAIGDGINDLKMLQKADLGIAFCAKEALRKEVPIQINEKNLLLAFDIIEKNLY